MAKFSVGQTVCHKTYNYRGVIIDVDATFQGKDKWYERFARSRPSKNQPWYRILVHEAASETYVAEGHLKPDITGDPVNHPEISTFFDGFDEGIYQFNHVMN
jgi:heat shock protein HspQ